MSRKNNGSIAPESDRTMKDRKKILKRYEELEAKLTMDRLEEAKQQISGRIERTSSERVVFQGKSGFGLYNANKDPVEPSSQVKKIADSLNKENSAE